MDSPPLSGSRALGIAATGPNAMMPAVRDDAAGLRARRRGVAWGRTRSGADARARPPFAWSRRPPCVRCVPRPLRSTGGPCRSGSASVHACPPPCLVPSVPGRSRLRAQYEGRVAGLSRQREHGANCWCASSVARCAAAVAQWSSRVRPQASCSSRPVHRAGVASSPWPRVGGRWAAAGKGHRAERSHLPPPRGEGVFSCARSPPIARLRRGARGDRLTAVGVRSLSVARGVQPFVGVSGTRVGGGWLCRRYRFVRRRRIG